MSAEDDNKFDDELMAKARELPRTAMPQRDLWPAIEEAIREPVAAPQRSPWNTVWAQAAAVVLLVAASSGITYYVTHDDGYRGPQVVSVDSVFEQVSGDFGASYSLGSEYLEARSQLEGSLEEKLAALTPVARADVIENLNTIRRAINDINEALSEQPDNVLLQKLLLSTYHEEMNLMIRVDGIANSAMRREDI